MPIRFAVLCILLATKPGYSARAQLASPPLPESFHRVQYLRCHRLSRPWLRGDRYRPGTEVRGWKVFWLEPSREGCSESWRASSWSAPIQPTLPACGGPSQSPHSWGDWSGCRN